MSSRFCVKTTIHTFSFRIFSEIFKSTLLEDTIYTEFFKNNPLLQSSIFHLHVEQDSNTLTTRVRKGHRILLIGWLVSPFTQTWCRFLESICWVFGVDYYVTFNCDKRVNRSWDWDFTYLHKFNEDKQANGLPDGK